MDKETNRLKKELSHLEKTYKTGIINEDEYREAKKKIDKKLKTHSKNVETEERKKKAIKDIINKPAVKPKATNGKNNKTKKKSEAVVPIKKSAEKPVTETKPINNTFNDNHKSKENNVWSYLFLLIVIVLILFFVYKYTETLAPVSKTIVIDEYSDFYCPYSAEMQKTLKDIKKEYGDNVKIYHTQFPNTDLHPMSRLAAEASECANEVNRFIEYHNLLFFGDTKPELEEDFIKLIESEKVDTDKTEEFKECLTKHLKASEVDEDIAKGKAAGVKMTPTLVIDGELLVGGQSFEVIKYVIDKHLK